MKLDFKCISCHINQVLKISDILGLDDRQKEKTMRKVLFYLHSADYNRTNPELLKETWDIIRENIRTEDPYQAIKSRYNRKILELENEITEIINRNENPLKTALKISILGNLIDFAGKNRVDDKAILKRIRDVDREVISKDQSDRLIDLLMKSETLLFIGDNCGEIVLDKILIKYIQQYNPLLKIYYGVRGMPIINDSTEEDALEVGMDAYATVISNEDGSPGTILDKTGEAFNRLFHEADLIISKGQGNFESLIDSNRNNLFFLFMIKCDVAARMIGGERNQIVCSGI